MNKVYINLNNVQTPVLTWGDPLTDKNSVIICITGNPGITDFYVDFASQLYHKMSIPVCVIGHAGHEESFNRKTKYLFNLMDQLEHKLDFIKNHINKNSKVHLIGHSIGAWMIMELLNKHNCLISRITSINLLFPTIQKMAESTNGKFINNVVRKMDWLILFLCKILWLLPKQILSYLISVYLWLKSLPSEFNSPILIILNPDIMENVCYLAFNEMDTVRLLNTEGMQKIKHLTNVVYSNIDGWAPIEYIEDLENFKPDLHMTETYNVEHAFVLKSSECVAVIVADFINTKIRIGNS